MKIAMLWKQGGFYGSVNVDFFLQGDLSDDHTRRYCELDQQGGCKNILEVLVGVFTMMEGRREEFEAGGSLAD